MKKLIIITAALLVTSPAYGQNCVQFMPTFDNTPVTRVSSSLFQTGIPGLHTQRIPVAQTQHDREMKRQTEEMERQTEEMQRQTEEMQRQTREMERLRQDRRYQQIQQHSRPNHRCW